uniref:PITH domain-containing protein n=1 Tax=Chromera velia CCMP2878 TaxID=1169474 RepID=A0A0G4I4D3_9ALVE|mmetsp:Transcript_42665/g.84163  ORF Transcript_42665/g.84163 Transcript_42665/m.84163 type:complete len:204 (-) Transcript_42665:126-737(-)|eukprot:Cvel_10860.t1-p1 / transcript=Cvel_10860.t1 / gene=Cvel_10860 / organism=Chromera_velia_CCMP2878 / gene_product=PITH domain-containing protein 1, putative / transcript_product=PITH domain-containing protein 1, putative / location=Cvel_scaffold665:42957-45310(-) / protein_length=203 / sequence_SO=supercontig / SO=protein_coding / is_pseudo=false
MPGEHGPGCGCRHETELTGGEWLLPFISIEGVRALNEEVEGSCRKVFKTWEERLSEESCSTPDDDPELIIHIPFCSPCKIASLIVIGGDGGKAPSRVKIFQNKEELDFSGVEDTEAVQEVELHEDFHGAIEYPLKITKLQQVSHLTLYFPENKAGDGPTQIFYIGIRGIGSNAKREAVETVYEQKPNVQDHKTGDEHIPHFGV